MVSKNIMALLHISSHLRAFLPERKHPLLSNSGVEVLLYKPGKRLRNNEAFFCTRAGVNCRLFQPCTGRHGSSASFVQVCSGRNLRPYSLNKP